MLHRNMSGVVYSLLHCTSNIVYELVVMHDVKISAYTVWTILNVALYCKTRNLSITESYVDWINIYFTFSEKHTGCRLPRYLSHFHFES